jgi:hypothetical protein
MKSHVNPMPPRGLIKDEGFASAAKIIFHGLDNAQNRPRFLTMDAFFPMSSSAA